MNNYDEIQILKSLEQKVLWLSTWMIHHANNIRPKEDNLKVGGHQASCASLVSVMTALFLRQLRANDRIAVKPHAGPVFHAIQYLLGNQTLDNLKKFRDFKGVQPYPSKTKDNADVDFSTGSVGMGVAATLFASLVQDYLHAHNLIKKNSNKSRMIALLGDAELDEGNIFEALLEGWKHDIRNCWWIVDYNRQSLDGVVNDKLFNRITGFFATVNWNVVPLKYGLKLQSAFNTKIGPALKNWIDECPNLTYSALTFQGGNGWRKKLSHDLNGSIGLKEFLDSYDDDSLNGLMTNLGGHDIQAILQAFSEAEKDDSPHCFIAYTIKGYNLPLAGHKDNHAGILNNDQVDQLKKTMGINEGKEWDKFSGMEIPESILTDYLKNVPFSKRIKRKNNPKNNEIISLPKIEIKKEETHSTQEFFGKMMNELGKGKSDLANRIVTTSPDVTVSTNLGGWVNQRSPFHVKASNDIFRQMHLPSPQKWNQSPNGQHIELGIAENNLFILLGMLGLSHDLFDERLIPIGTLYDPFISRGLDAMTYSCYQDARFILVATPSGISLGPEGGAHQSIFTPLVGIGHPNLIAYEPAFADELEKILVWSFSHIQKEDGASVYLRLSTRQINQPQRELCESSQKEIIDGGYWIIPPKKDSELALIYCGVIAPEVLEAFKLIEQDIPDSGVLAVTSPDRLHADWNLNAKKRRLGKKNSRSHIENLLSILSKNANLITIHDGHPLALSWIGSVSGHKCFSLGVEKFGEAGTVKQLYKEHNIDTSSIINAIADSIIQTLKA